LTSLCHCKDWPFPDESGSDGWYGYRCVNMLVCLNPHHSTNDTTTQYTVTEVKFNDEENFFIDNLAFAWSIINGKLHIE